MDSEIKKYLIILVVLIPIVIGLNFRANRLNPPEPRGDRSGPAQITIPWPPSQTRGHDDESDFSDRDDGFYGDRYENDRIDRGVRFR